MIELDSGFDVVALAGLSDFSHVEIVFHFDRVAVDRVETGVRHPRGLDAVDGMPVLDIKPVLREFLAGGTVRQPAWASELMAGYWTRSA